MASFVHPSYPEQHPGVERFEAGVAAVRKGFEGKPSRTAVVLAALVASFLVLADQAVGTLGSGHFLSAWVVLWVAAFALVAVLAPMLRGGNRALLDALNAWARRVARARADERMWALAQQDPRVMADLKMAITRSEAQESMAGNAAAPVAGRNGKVAGRNGKAAVQAETFRPFPTQYV